MVYLVAIILYIMVVAMANLVGRCYGGSVPPLYKYILFITTTYYYI